MKRARPSFSPDLFSFLGELRLNNDREWFKAHKPRYEELVRDPALEFISEFAPRLGRISPHLVADPRPVGGSLFRIYRDIRFSKDEKPFKTHVGIQFRHQLARDVHAPGFYLHLEPANSLAAAGIWHPDGGTLGRIREAISARPEDWRRVTQEPPFGGLYRLEGDSLRRPPAGYQGDDPLIEDLKRKDFIGVTPLTEERVTSAGFVDDYAQICRAAVPFLSFLCEAVDVPF